MVVNVQHGGLDVEAELYINDDDQYVVEKLVVFNEFGEVVPDYFFDETEMTEILDAVYEEADYKYGKPHSETYVF